MGAKDQAGQGYQGGFHQVYLSGYPRMKQGPALIRKTQIAREQVPGGFRRTPEASYQRKRGSTSLCLDGRFGAFYARLQDEAQDMPECVQHIKAAPDDHDALRDGPEFRILCSDHLVVAHCRA